MAEKLNDDQEAGASDGARTMVEIILVGAGCVEGCSLVPATYTREQREQWASMLDAWASEQAATT